MKDPAILLYTGDFLNGCMDLTMEERGQYITLLCMQHQKGHLSDKTIRLTVGSASVDVLRKFVKDNDGSYFNKRMEDEIQKRTHFIETRTVNGKKGGRPKKANGKPKNNLIEDEDRNEDISSNDNKNKEIESVFDIFRIDYPGTKRGLIVELDNFKKKHKDWKEIIPTLNDALTYQKSAREIKRQSGGFVPEWKNLQTWINQRCWEEEINNEDTMPELVAPELPEEKKEYLRSIGFKGKIN